jgi:hypothetical protein
VEADFVERIELLIHIWQMKPTYTLLFLYSLDTFPLGWRFCETYAPLTLKLPLKTRYASLPHVGFISVQT